MLTGEGKADLGRLHRPGGLARRGGGTRVPWRRQAGGVARPQLARGTWRQKQTGRTAGWPKLGARGVHLAARTWWMNSTGGAGERGGEKQSRGAFM